MVLGRKTNFFLGKRWFWAEKTNFFQGKREKDGLGQENQNFFLGKTKQTIILDFGRIVSQKIFFFF